MKQDSQFCVTLVDAKYRRDFSGFKVNKAMYEGKHQEIFTQNDSKYHNASKYLDTLNQVQSYQSVYQNKKKMASLCRIASGLSVSGSRLV